MLVGSVGKEGPITGCLIPIVTRCSGYNNNNNNNNNNKINLYSAKSSLKTIQGALHDNMITCS